MKPAFFPRVWIVIGILLVSIAPALAEVDHAMVQSRFDAGKVFAQNGDYASALNEFLWCFDEGMVQVPSFAGVRVSFLLGEIGKMLKTYPLAREALIERADAAEKRALKDPNDRRAPADFAALCATLGDDARLVHFFDALPPTDSRRQALGLRAFRIFLPQQRYADALAAMPFERMVSLWNSTAKRPTPAISPRASASLLRSTITLGLDFVEVLAGAGDLKHAREMIDLLVDLDASRETQSQLEERLKRAGQPDLLKEPANKK